jgi:hypothetical protein
MGRSKGALNYKTRDAETFARSVVSDPEYRAAIRQRAIDGTLGVMEQTLWHYAYGKPKERLELSMDSGPDLSALPPEELAAQLNAIVNELNDVIVVEAHLRKELGPALLPEMASEPELPASTEAVPAEAPPPAENT